MGDAMPDVGTIMLSETPRLRIERTEQGDILLTEGRLTLRLDHTGLERLYEAVGDALAVLAMVDMGFPPLPLMAEGELAAK